MAVIVLPLLPNMDVGPVDAINPRSLGLMVVTIAGLSFLGYVAIKLFGAKRGLLVGAALGGLVSSTATTLSFATRTKEHPDLAPVAAGAIAIAWAIMLVRVGVANEYLGAEGLYLASAISGATDVDAVVISSTRLATGDVADVVATTAIMIAIAANTIVKTVMAWSIGRSALGKRVAVTGALIILAGGVALAVTALA